MTQAMNLANFANSLDTSGQMSPTNLSSPVPVSKGGTNAATISDARTNLDVYSTTQTNTAIAAASPTGEIKMWATATAPSGFLLCDGTSISTTTYAALFAVIGYTFGGSGATFNLPDFRDRMPIGAGSTYAVNASGGSADAVVVNHTHSASLSATFTGAALPTHTHLGYSSGSGSQRVVGDYGGPGSLALGSTAPTSAGTPSGTISGTVTNTATGVSGTNANLPPYRGISFIIKT